LFGLRRSGRSNAGTNAADQTVHVTALYAVFCAIGVDTCNLCVDLSPEGRICTGSHTHTSTDRLLLRCSIAEKISCFLGGVGAVDARCEKRRVEAPMTQARSKAEPGSPIAHGLIVI
jgi:exosortase/archaeosortase